MRVLEQEVKPINSSLKQIVLWIGANAGGVSKTTLAIHLAYEMANRGMSIAIFDLDTNVSMSQFTGLGKNPSWQETLAYVLSEDFKGDWPLATPSWGLNQGKVQICRGGPVMAEATIDLTLRKRREYLLRDRLIDYPLPHDLIILDCPATLSNLSDVALVAATHLLIPLEATPKSFSGCDALLTWYRVTCRQLRLQPAPPILGIVPVRYDSSEAIQRDYYAMLPQMLQPQGIKCYSSIRYSREFINASEHGVPLQIYRPNHKACSDFLSICNDLSQLLESE